MQLHNIVMKLKHCHKIFYGGVFLNKYVNAVSVENIYRVFNLYSQLHISLSK